jgi:hypothetical protein
MKEESVTEEAEKVVKANLRVARNRGSTVRRRLLRHTYTMPTPYLHPTFNIRPTMGGATYSHYFILIEYIIQQKIISTETN